MEDLTFYLLGLSALILAATALAAYRRGCRGGKKRENERGPQRAPDSATSRHVATISVETVSAPPSAPSPLEAGVTWVYRTPLGESSPYRLPYVIDVREYFDPPPPPDKDLPTYEDIFGKQDGKRT